MNFGKGLEGGKNQVKFPFSYVIRSILINLGIMRFPHLLGSPGCILKSGKKITSPNLPVRDGYGPGRPRAGPGPKFRPVKARKLKS